MLAGCFFVRLVVVFWIVLPFDFVCCLLEFKLVFVVDCLVFGCLGLVDVRFVYCLFAGRVSLVVVCIAIDYLVGGLVTWFALVIALSVSLWFVWVMLFGGLRIIVS